MSRPCARHETFMTHELPFFSCVASYDQLDSRNRPSVMPARPSGPATAKFSRCARVIRQSSRARWSSGLCCGATVADSSAAIRPVPVRPLGGWKSAQKAGRAGGRADGRAGERTDGGFRLAQWRHCPSRPEAGHQRAARGEWKRTGQTSQQLREGLAWPLSRRPSDAPASGADQLRARSSCRQQERGPRRAGRCPSERPARGHLLERCVASEPPRLWPHSYPGPVPRRAHVEAGAERGGIELSRVRRKAQLAASITPTAGQHPGGAAQTGDTRSAPPLSLLSLLSSLSTFSTLFLSAPGRFAPLFSSPFV